MTNQSPVEALRQQLIEKYMETAEAFYFEGSDETTEREKYAPEFADELMELVTSYAATVERETDRKARIDELKHIDGLYYDTYIEESRRNEPIDVLARLAALQGAQEETDDPS